MKGIVLSRDELVAIESRVGGLKHLFWPLRPGRKQRFLSQATLNEVNTVPAVGSNPGHNGETLIQLCNNNGGPLTCITAPYSTGDIVAVLEKFKPVVTPFSQYVIFHTPGGRREITGANLDYPKMDIQISGADPLRQSDAFQPAKSLRCEHARFYLMIGKMHIFRHGTIGPLAWPDEIWDRMYKGMGVADNPWVLMADVTVLTVK